MQKTLAHILQCNIVLFAITPCVFSYCGLAQIQDIVNPLVRKWAPKVILQRDETYFPTNVDVFLRNIDIKTSTGEKKEQSESTGRDSRSYYFVTKEDKNSLMEDPSSFLHGTKPTPTETVPAFAFVDICESDDRADQCNNMIITYWFFYGFKQGKNLCKTPLGKPVGCPEGYKWFGHQVGDWQHITLKIRDKKPSILFLSVHDVGVVYNYQQDQQKFFLSRKIASLTQEVDRPPDQILIDSQGHPVVYAARGSHSFFAGSGTFGYDKLDKDKLDVTSDASEGVIWKTWNSMQVFTSTANYPWWYNFEGRWGNQKDECIAGISCTFDDGPVGLSTRAKEDRFTCSNM